MKYVIKEYVDIKEKVMQMSLHQLLQVVVCPNMQDMENDASYENTVSMLLHAAPAEKSTQYIKKICKSTKEPRLFCADLECGAGNVAVGMTRFPSFMACKAAGGAEYAYKMGQVCAEEARQVGFNWTFSPCVDIVLNQNAPIVSTRSAGETPEEVIEIAGAYMKALQENGVAATLKHFPGDGICENDQHLTTPENPLSMEEWYATYGKVYRELIEQGVKAIMPGHISLPAYDEKDKELDMYPPATLSKRILTELLKGELGFQGIIVSDAVNMGGFCGYMNYYDACCRFLEAGGDVLLFAHMTPVFEEKMKKAIEEGRLTMETLRNRAYRVLCFAKEMMETEDKVKASERKNEEVANEIVHRACTVVRDRKQLLPFKIEKDTKVLHLLIHNNYVDEDVKRLTEVLKTISDHVEECENPGPDYIRKIAEEGRYDLIICTVGCRFMYGTNVIKLHGPMARNMMLGWTKFDTPVIFVNHGHPWLGEEYKAVMDTLINTYGCCQGTAEAVVKKIIGENVSEK